MMRKAKILAVLALSLGLVLVACGATEPVPATQRPDLAASATPETASTPMSPAATLLPSTPSVTEDDRAVEPEMILIPAGEFTMGSDPGLDQDASADEQPQHTLYLPDYYLAKTTVTNDQYAAFVQATGHASPYGWQGGKSPRGREDHPVVNVSWHDAQAYCTWLAEATGKPYRLPSEAEWEKGARGTDGRIYPWGNQWDAAQCNSRESGNGDTTPVGDYPEGASPYGLLDMAGNVWEWTGSAYKDYPHDMDGDREDLEASDDVRRVLRGGSFGNLPWRVRCALRGGDLSSFSFWDRGFRVALDAGQSPASND
jgi:formylglycine-generating enzyme required for sulfatase activity